MATGELSDAQVFGAAPSAGQPPLSSPSVRYVTLPDGRTLPQVDINQGSNTPTAPSSVPVSSAPAEMSDKDVFGSATPGPTAPALPAPTRSDEMLGFNREVARPVYNAADWIYNGLNAATGGGMDKLAANPTLNRMGFTTPAQEQAKLDAPVQAAAAQGVVPGKIGSFLGNVVGTAPTMALPGGPLVQGAAMGALSTQNPNDLGQTAISTGAGLAGGALGAGAVKLGTAVVLPKISSAARVLMDAGMTDSLSPGMMAPHSIYNVGEKVGQVLPLVGEMLRSQGNDSLIAANRAVANRVAGGFGGQATGDTGADLINSVTAAKNAAYDIKVPGGAPLDPIYANQANSIRANVAQFPKETGIGSSFDRLQRVEVAARADPATGNIPEDQLTSAKNAISQEIADWSGDSSGYARQYVRQLKAYRTAFTQNLGRTSSQAADQLAQADANYPSYKVFAEAARRGKLNSTNFPDYFTPQQLQSAIGSQVDNGQVVANAAPLQDLASAMKTVLPRKFKDVSSAGHSLAEGLVSMGVAGADVMGGHGGQLATGVGLGLPLASTMGMKVIRPILLAQDAARRAADPYIPAALRFASVSGSQAAPQVASPYLPALSSYMSGLFASPASKAAALQNAP